MVAWVRTEFGLGRSTIIDLSDGLQSLFIQSCVQKKLIAALKSSQCSSTSLQMVNKSFYPHTPLCLLKECDQVILDSLSPLGCCYRESSKTDDAC